MRLSLLLWSFNTLLLLLLSAKCNVEKPLVNSSTQAKMKIISFPQPWMKTGVNGNKVIVTTPQEFVIRKAEGTSGGELLFGLMEPYGLLSESFYGVSLDGEFRTCSVTKQAWEQAQEVSTKSLGRLLKIDAEVSADLLRYRGKSFAKTGASWSETAAALPSPSGTWIAVFSYTSTEKSKSRDVFPFLGGNEPGTGEVFVDIYNTSSGDKVLTGNASFKKISPSSLFTGAVWAEERFFTMPLDNLSQTCFLGMLPSD